MSVDSMTTVEESQIENPFHKPDREHPSDYGSVKDYVEQVTPKAFAFHCIQEAIKVCTDEKYKDECMSHTPMGILYFAVNNNPYLKQREKLDDVCFEMDKKQDVLALLERLLETRKAFHKH